MSGLRGLLRLVAATVTYAGMSAAAVSQSSSGQPVSVCFGNTTTLTFTLESSAVPPNAASLGALANATLPPLTTVCQNVSLSPTIQNPTWLATITAANAPANPIHFSISPALSLNQAVIRAATNGPVATTVILETGQSSPGVYNSSFFIQPSTAPQLSNWMSKIPAGTKLNAITMPGSHDAGMYTATSCSLSEASWTLTQNRSIADQLAAGSRYFDLRPYLQNVQDYVETSPGVLSPAPTLNNYFHGHYSLAANSPAGCLGASMATVIADVVKFLDANKTETVILNFSHTDSQYQPLGQMGQVIGLPPLQVAAAFMPLALQAFPEGMVYSVDPLTRIGELPLSTLAGKVVITVDNTFPQYFYPSEMSGGEARAKSQFLKASAFASASTACPIASSGSLKPMAGLPVLNNYSNSNIFTTMQSNQMSQLSACGGYAQNYLFLLSWTLTAQVQLGPVLDIAGIAPVANVNIPGAIAQIKAAGKYPNIFYYDRVDPYLGQLIVNMNNLQP